MVPSSNRLGNGPLKAEIGVRTSVESPNAVFMENERTNEAWLRQQKKENHVLKLDILADIEPRISALPWIL